MNLHSKLESINSPFDKDQVPKYTEGKAETISEFWERFVKPRLPKKEVVEEWHKLLMEYVKDTENITCGIRYGNNRQKLESGETGDDALRRGWLTQNINDGFRYFYADNFFLAFFDKLYIDAKTKDDVPSLKEFKEMFEKLEFPYAYHHRYTTDKSKEFKYHKLPVGKDPGFSKEGYKICHIIGTGTNYMVGKKRYREINDLAKDYFNLGCTSDWEMAQDNVRRMEISEEDKKVIIAVFLRFIHPMNNFLSPSKYRQKHGPLFADDENGKKKAFNNDIGEYPGLCEYAQAYMRKEYKEKYDEFCELIMLPEDSKIDEKCDEKIDVEYNVTWSKSDNLGEEFEEFKTWLLSDGENKVSNSTFNAYRSALNSILTEEDIEFEELCNCISEKINEYIGTKEIPAIPRKKEIAKRNAGTGAAVLKKIATFMSIKQS